MDLMNVLLRLGIVAFLVLMNAFFVAAEFAMVNFGRTRVEHLARQGSKIAASVLVVQQNLGYYIAAIQLGITVASLALGWIGEETVARLLESVFAFMPPVWMGITTHSVAITLAFVFITTLHVVLAEQVPKVVALRYSERVAFFLVGPLRAAAWIMRPLVVLLNGSGNALLRILRIPPAQGHLQVHSVEELSLLVDASHQGGELGDEERAMLDRVLRFRSLPVRQVMVPRVDMVTLPANIGWEELGRRVRENGYSRYPVQGASQDEILGILYTKDLLWLSEEQMQAFETRQHLRPAVTVPESLLVPKLLALFTAQRIQMAIVGDEYGGVAGLVTVEDALEQIVGEIRDEYDVGEEEEQIRTQPDGSFRMPGATHMVDLERALGVSFGVPDAESVAGLIQNHIGRLPKAGESIEIQGYLFVITKASGPRLDELVCHKQPAPPVRPQKLID